MGSAGKVIKSLLRWAKVSRDGDDAGNYPVQQVTYLGKVGDALVWLPYGYHAVVPADTLAFLASMQGNPEARVAMPGSPTLRPRIAAGEVVVYHPPTGSKIHFRANGDVEVTGVRDVSVTAAGDATVSAGGDVDVNAVGEAKVESTGGLAKLEGNTVEIVSTVGGISIQAATALDCDALSGPASFEASGVTTIGKIGEAKFPVRVNDSGGAWSDDVEASS